MDHHVLSPRAMLREALATTAHRTVYTAAEVADLLLDLGLALDEHYEAESPDPPEG